MALTEAMKEAYAAVPAGVFPIETIELDHVTFDEPARIVTGVDDDMSLPLAAGQAPVAFIRSKVSIVLPGQTEDGPTTARITIENVSAILFPYLRLAIQSDQPITVIYRAYRSDDLSQPGDVIDGLELWDVDLDMTSATATLKFKELEAQAFPLSTYDRQFYPALQNL